MDVKIEASWKKRLSNEFDQPYFIELTAFVKQEYATKQIFPPGKLIFHAFEQSPFDQTKVVILGQDPYHGPGQAHGLCFSVPEGIQLPPSLQNIFREISQDMGIPTPTEGNLDRWASQGVLLLTQLAGFNPKSKKNQLKMQIFRGLNRNIFSQYSINN